MNNQYPYRPNLVNLNKAGPVREKRNFDFSKLPVKQILMGIGGLLLIAILILLLSNHHKNNTGRNYLDKDVTYNCTKKYKINGIKATEKLDVLFNNGMYETSLYHRIDIDHIGSDLTYKSIIKELVKEYSNGKYLNNYEIPNYRYLENEDIVNNMTFNVVKDLGEEVSIDRVDDKIIIVYENHLGPRVTADKKAIKSRKSALKLDGYKCK